MKAKMFLIFIAIFFTAFFVPKNVFAGCICLDEDGNETDCADWVAIDCNWTCFAAGTKVNMSGGEKANIEDVKVGDKVISQSENGKKSVSTVTKLDQPIREHMCRLEFDGNKALKMTEEHPLMTSDGWKALDPNKTKDENPNLIVRKLEVGDKVVRDDGTLSELKSVSCWSEKTQAYNLILDGNVNTYFADGFLAHNKGGEVLSCPAGTHDNGRCSAGNLNPPCCSADVTVTATVTVPITVTTTVSPTGGGGSGCTEGGPYGDDSACGRYRLTFDCRGPIFRCNECGPHTSYSSCSPITHTRTITTSKDCTAATTSVTEDCTGEIRGTLFDATNLSACPSFDPSTGYLIGVDTSLTANNRTFGFADQNNTSPHPWSPLTTAQTNSSGNYSVRVYAPTTYTYDFSSFSDIYVVSSGPKLTCTSTTAVVPGSSTGCTTQPCSIVNNMSFGFERYWGGWWQVVGASVHGQNGLKSSIPSSYPSEQSLILGDGTATNRSGVVSYGTLVNEMLGINPSAKVSTNLWQVQSSYQGSRYDHDYFNQQFKKYTVTTWNGSDSIVYNDGGRGYQIFKVTGDIANFSYNPTGTEKVIFLVDGNVTVSSNITVPSGAYLALLSSGDISFSTSVTRADGWYLANNINVRCVDANTDLTCDRTDVQFLGNGSFVGWQGINLSRDRGAVLNMAGPAEKFTYRKDLYENAPEPMKIVTKRYEPYVP